VVLRMLLLQAAVIAYLQTRRERTGALTAHSHCPFCGVPDGKGFLLPRRPDMIRPTFSSDVSGPLWVESG
jgi:hypothetical protein